MNTLSTRFAVFGTVATLLCVGAGCGSDGSDASVDNEATAGNDLTAGDDLTADDGVTPKSRFKSRGGPRGGTGGTTAGTGGTTAGTGGTTAGTGGTAGGTGGVALTCDLCAKANECCKAVGGGPSCSFSAVTCASYPPSTQPYYLSGCLVELRTILGVQPNPPAACL